MAYTQLSYTLTKQLSKIDKQQQGIFFTPPKTIQDNLDLLFPYMKDVRTVLEPSCGSGEYIISLHARYPHVSITGIEKHETIFDSISHLQNKQCRLLHQNFLTYQNESLYDMIIGNPPYFVVKKHDVDQKYHPYFEGRPNMFILFIIKSLSMLKQNGILSFILPKNFLSCSYYTNTRKYICDTCNILHIIECKDPYIETKQDTICLIIRKKKSSNKKYIVNDCVFGLPANIRSIKQLYKGSTTLEKLGCNVHVGTVVWNQCKDILTDDSSKTRLIYSSDIKDNKLHMKSYSNPDKKNYIDKPGIKKPLLVLNRGYGSGRYSFDYCMIDGEIPYLIENHLICISYKSDIDKDALILLYNKIIQSWQDKKTHAFIELYFGNNAMNTKELATVLPIYDI